LVIGEPGKIQQLIHSGFAAREFRLLGPIQKMGDNRVSRLMGGEVPPHRRVPFFKTERDHLRGPDLQLSYNDDIRESRPLRLISARIRVPAPWVHCPCRQVPSVSVFPGGISSMGVIPNRRKFRRPPTCALGYGISRCSTDPTLACCASSESRHCPVSIERPSNFKLTHYRGDDLGHP
jgi:hypothetical protein